MNKFVFCLLILVVFCLSESVVDGQGVPARRDSSQVTVERKELDSLEFALLRTTQTYDQLEHVINTISLEPAYLDMIPCVLPVMVPLEAFRITSPFGIRRHPIHQQLRFHNGVDVKAPAGMVVKATAGGIIKQVGIDPALGVFVRIQHVFGFETTYGHLSGFCVKAGQTVKRGDW